MKGILGIIVFAVVVLAMINTGDSSPTKPEAAYSKPKFESPYANNSSFTGDTPYSECYGHNESCSAWSCSEVKVKSGSNDVIVFVKQFGETVRHAYIKTGSSYTFEVPNGRYQVFFYSGTGWNPNQEITSTDCSQLTGKFVANESFQKDDPIRLNNQIMEYTLYSVINGNFHTKGSSAQEVFR